MNEENLEAPAAAAGPDIVGESEDGGRTGSSLGVLCFVIQFRR
jgi:hypothetical protein